MIIRIDDIYDEGLTLDFEEKPETFPTLTEITRAGECQFIAPLKIHLRAIRVQEIVEVEGKIETVVRLSCSRCLKEFEMPLVTPFAVAYTRQLPEVIDEFGEEEIELSAEESGLILFHGDEIDLRDGIQEEVVMALPLRPLCREDCKGLCPQCGADLNEGDCGCKRAAFNTRFAALKDFKVKKK